VPAGRLGARRDDLGRPNRYALAQSWGGGGRDTLVVTGVNRRKTRTKNLDKKRFKKKNSGGRYKAACPTNFAGRKEKIPTGESFLSHESNEELTALGKKILMKSPKMENAGLRERENTETKNVKKKPRKCRWGIGEK